MKWVAMARHGPILKDNEATGSGKVFKYLRGFRDIIKKSKMAAKVQKSKNTAFYRIFIYGELPIYRPGGHYVKNPRHYASRSEGLPKRDIPSLGMMGGG